MYEVVFTNVRTHMDMVGKCAESGLVSLIQSMLGEGWFLSELKKADD